jgi:hypothetical protein
MAALKLSKEDQKHLKTLEPKLQVVRDRVRGVVQSIHTGFYLWGEGGTSKSFTVLNELQARQADYVLHNSRMTGRGLLDWLQRLPSSIHVIEDCESMFSDKRAWGVLRSALWSQDIHERPMRREITWAAFNTVIRFTFTGSLIIIANKPLEAQPIPELSALSGRITVNPMVATFNEIAALMRSVALKGFPIGLDYVSPTECMEVTEFVIEEMRSLERPLDMRVFVHGVKDYFQDKIGHSKTDWRTLIRTRLHHTTLLPERRADVISRETTIALELSQMNLSRAERAKLWKEKTGKSERAYWRRLRDAEERSRGVV